MADKLDARPTAATYQLEQLVDMVRSGQVRVPHFQRDFRWGKEDVRRLFDSILKGYPIGSLLLWQRPADAKTLTLGALRIDAPAQDRALWVVDGQQRIISLVNVLDSRGQHDERFALSYDLLAGEFVTTPSAPRSTTVPLPVLFDLQQLLNWFAEHPEISQYVNEANSVTSTLRQYPISANQVNQEDPQVLRDIFDRLNNYGKRLKRAEIFAALNAADEQEDPNSLTFELIAEHVESRRDFGRIDADTVLKAILARRGPDVLRDIRNEFGEGDTEGRDVAYREGESALERAVVFLQEDAHVPHVGVLANRYLLVVLARFFALHPDPGERDRQLLRRWYWRAAVVGPGHFKGGTTGAIRKLCKLVGSEDASAGVQGLLDAVSDVAPPALPDLGRFSAREATTKIVLCSWWDAGPRSPRTGEPYDRGQLARCLDERQTAGEAVQSLVVSSALPRQHRSHAANRVLMPADNGDGDDAELLLAERAPEDGDIELHAVLESHAMTRHLVSLLADDKVADFVAERAELLRQRLHDFLGRMCEWGFESTPPLAGLVLDEDDFPDDLFDTGTGPVLGG